MGRQNGLDYEENSRNLRAYMKILIITPFYYIEGRPDLQHDTNAIHYFAKYWSYDNEVKVLNVYPHSYKDLKR